MEVRKAALCALIKIIEKEKQFDAVLKEFRDKVKSPAEFGLIVSGTVKQKLTLDYFIQAVSSKRLNSLSHNVLNVLRLAIYEIEYLKHPEYAVLNSYVNLIKVTDSKAVGFVNAILRNFLRKRESIVFPCINEYPEKHLSIKYSHPEWMVSRWIKEYGVEAVEKICEYNNLPPKLVIRINTIKISKNDLIKLFNEHNISFQDNCTVKDCLSVDFVGDIKSVIGFKEGYWLIQGESSSLVSFVIDPKKEDKILDMCAAPGGKTAHIAALTNNKSEITALDISESRLAKISENNSRLGVTSVNTVTADASIFKSNEKFDKILIDAPCSNTGVLVKRIDARWKRQPQDVSALAKLQLLILNNASTLLKDGGIIVYSTCSIEKDENNDVIEAFLAENKNYVLDDIQQYIPWKIFKNSGYVQILQSEHNMDGFFIAGLKKIGN